MSHTRNRHGTCCAFLVAAVCFSLVGCKQRSAPPPTASPVDSSAPPTVSIPRALTRDAPLADPKSTPARDEAARALGRLDVLLNNSDEQVLWGIRDAAAPVDPARNKTIQLHPLVLAKLYLSLFMFSGEPTTRQEGPFTAVEVPARFRDGLPPGDYPHPLWHNPDHWDAYRAAKSITLVFVKDRLTAIYVPASTGAVPAASPTMSFDGHWHWTDKSGTPQPRVAAFSYLLSPENPHLAPLTAAYQRIQEKLRAQGCLACHSPDNKHDTRVLILLDYPSQALAVRYALAAVLKENAMPPGDARHGKDPGIADESARQELITRADVFEAEAVEALFFESDKRGVPRPPVIPPRPPPDPILRRNPG